MLDRLDNGIGFFVGQIFRLSSLAGLYFGGAVAETKGKYNRGRDDHRETKVKQTRPERVESGP